MSYYLNPTNALARLRKEWLEHDGLIVAVDFDSTLCPYKKYEYEADSELVRQLVRELYEHGCTIVIWTAAEKARHEEVKQYLYDRGIRFHYFNEDVEDIKYKTRKLYANAYLDDRAGLHEVYAMLYTLLQEAKIRNLDKQLDTCDG